MGMQTVGTPYCSVLQGFLYKWQILVFYLVGLMSLLAFSQLLIPSRHFSDLPTKFIKISALLKN